MRSLDEPLARARFSDEDGQFFDRIRGPLSRVYDKIRASNWRYLVMAIAGFLGLVLLGSVVNAWRTKPAQDHGPSEARQPGAGVFTVKQFRDHISFGDSYSSERVPNDTDTPGGGRTWDRFVADYSGANLHNFAVSGAICTDAYWPSYSTSRSRQIQDQLPAWLSSAESTHLSADTTVYSNWIGTNDLGVDGFLIGGENDGTNITTFIECNWQVWDTVYANGGRYFVILNEAPLQFTPMYAAVDEGGIEVTHYWRNKTDYNTHEMSRHMMEYTLLVNQAFAYGLPYQLLIANRWPGATVVLYDVHQLLTDIHDSPTAYLDSPANATGSWQNCPTSDREKCENSPEAKSTFQWYDELHPSERTDEWVARGFVDIVLHGNSSYATYWKSNG